MTDTGDTDTNSEGATLAYWNRRLSRELGAIKKQEPRRFAAAAATLSMPKTTLNQICEGTHVPDGSQIQSLLTAFAISAEYIFSGISDENDLGDREADDWRALTNQVRAGSLETGITFGGIMGQLAQDVLSEIGDRGFSIAIGDATNPNELVVSNLPPAWINTYVAERYFEHDPVILWSIKQDGVANWRDIERTRRGQQMMDAAARIGFVNGTAITLRYLHHRCLLSLVHTAEDLAPEAIEDASTALMTLAMLHHRRMAHRYTAKNRSLAARYASGLTDEQIAADIGVTDRTIRNRKASLLEETGAATLAQAVCKAAASQ